MENYLKKYTIREQLIGKLPNEELALTVVIPAHDELTLLPAIESLAACDKPEGAVEVIIVFNAAENDSKEVKDRNMKAQRELNNWYKNQRDTPFQLLMIEENNLPKKHAGVGLARKIGMDEGVRRYNQINKKNGILVCFDADSLCEVNYLNAIQAHFKNQLGAVSIHFEHPLRGKDFSEHIYRGIYWYELHLRYYKNGLHFAELPYAFHTIGSSMAVDVVNYCKQGGMNRKKAGEDFYFLQKFIDVGLISELNTTKVIPSPRASHRVPFGTGRAIQEMLDDARVITDSYAFDCFITLKKCFKEIETWYTTTPQWDTKLVDFYGLDFLQNKLKELRVQSTDSKRFKKRFFQWFNAFQCLKFIHFLRDNYYKNRNLAKESEQLINALKLSRIDDDPLKTLRAFDRKD